MRGICATVRQIDGVAFVDRLDIGEPDMNEHGVGLYLVGPEPSLDGLLKTMGFRKVRYDANYLADLYVRGRMPWCWVQTVSLVIKWYWKMLRILYFEGRVFQQIPSNKPFSWRYFTPYTWLVRLCHRREV